MVVNFQKKADNKKQQVDPLNTEPVYIVDTLLDLSAGEFYLAVFPVERAGFWGQRGFYYQLTEFEIMTICGELFSPFRIVQ